MVVDLKRFSGKCACGHTHNIDVKELIIEPKATSHLKRLLKEYYAPVFICDANTKAATYTELHNYFDMGSIVELEGEHIHADNNYVLEILNKMKSNADMLIAVGNKTVINYLR